MITCPGPHRRIFNAAVIFGPGVLLGDLALRHQLLGFAASHPVQRALRGLAEIDGNAINACKHDEALRTNLCGEIALVRSLSITAGAP